ncbi:hypothetical protein GCM10020001_058740 [Nonomuraea salmonea]
MTGLRHERCETRWQGHRRKDQGRSHQAGGRAQRTRDHARPGHRSGGGDDPGSQIYVAGKHRDCAEVGIASIRVDLPATASQTDVEAAIDELNASPACTGYIVQLPLPKHLDTMALLERIDPAKDADGLHPVNLGRLVHMVDAPLPCTPHGIVLLLREYGVPIKGAEVAVVGRGITVGRSLGLLLTRRSENATVTLCHTGTQDLASHVRRADIVVAAAGVPELITRDMVKPGGPPFSTSGSPGWRARSPGTWLRTSRRSPVTSRPTRAASAR